MRFPLAGGAEACCAGQIGGAPSGRQVTSMSTVLRAFAVAAVYFAAARYVLALHDLVGLGGLFWPGAGVAVTGLLLSPRRMWPAILVAVGLAELANDLLTGFGLVPSLGWMLANMVEAALAAWLIQRWKADGLASVRATAAFLVAASAAPVAGAAIGALATSVYVSPLPYLVSAGQWVIGDALGILTVVPFGLMLFGRLPSERLLSLEGTAALLAVTATALLVFGVGATNPLLAGQYLVLIPMLWAAVRLGIAGAAVSLFIVAQLGSGLHALGYGLFVELESFTEVQAAAQLKLFLVTVAVTSLLLASRSRESETFHALADSRERLVAAVSHELRTPLTAIVGFSELLLHRSGKLSAAARQAGEVIHRNGLHLTALVEQLLQVSRARGATLPVDPQVIELRPLLETLVAQRRDDRIELDEIPLDTRVVADRFHLTQIVTNLLDNALRHGAPPVEVSVSTNRGHTELSVTDHGEGVPAWFTARLFDDFAQAVDNDQRATLGLGLGLPISRTLAEANNGQLDYRDSGQNGACFVLRLPSATTATTATPHDPRTSSINEH